MYSAQNNSAVLKLSSCSQRACAREALNCFTYCLLVYNPPPLTHTRLLQAGPPRGLKSCNLLPKNKPCQHFILNSFPQVLPWQGGQGMVRSRQGGRLKGRLARLLKRARHGCWRGKGPHADPLCQTLAFTLLDFTLF